jgi:FkbM family methyltransferase
MGVVDRVPAPLTRWISRQQFRPYVGPLVKRAASWLRHGPRTVGAGQAKGLRIDPAGANPGYALGTSEPAIQDLLAASVSPGSVVWDVGANIGFYTLIAARLVGAGRVVAFEPLPANCAAIRRNLALNGITNVQIVEVALSEESGTASLEIHQEHTWAKLDTSADTAFKQDIQPASRIEVAASTLDAQLEALGPPALVKIDIEGAEAAALRGAVTLMREVRPVLICELHGTNGPVMDLLDAYGYAAETVDAPGVPPREAAWSAHIIARPA